MGITIDKILGKPLKHKHKAEDIVGLDAQATHNDLSGLQGGTTGEYYHLTASQVSNIGGLTPINIGAVGTYKYYVPGWFISGVANVTPTYNVLYFIPVIFHQDTSVNLLASQVTTQGTGTEGFRMGIYSWGTNNLPNALLYQSAKISTVGTGEKTHTLNQTITKGLYFFAHISQSGIFRGSSTTTPSPFSGRNDAVSATTRVIPLYATANTYVDDGLPTTAPTPTGIDSGIQKSAFVFIKET